MIANVINRRDISVMEALLFHDGLLYPAPHYKIMQFDRETQLNFMLHYGIYVLPTCELIDFLQQKIIGSAIEIGCGTGAIGRALKIPLTDAMIQDNPEVQLFYSMLRTPVIAYPRDAEKLTAELAIKKYNPDTVIGAYITHKYNGKSGNAYGPVEGKILSSCSRYINIGNDDVHHDKPILKHPHEVYRFPWLISRSDPDKNHIKIFTNLKHQ